MAIIADYMDGECRIVIYDDCIVKTQEEVEEIKRRIAENYVYYRLKDLEAKQAAEKSIS